MADVGRPRLSRSSHVKSAITFGRGAHLHTCRVKIIDTDTFPSSKYEEHLRPLGEQRSSFFFSADRDLSRRQ